MAWSGWTGWPPGLVGLGPREVKPHALYRISLQWNEELRKKRPGKKLRLRHLLQDPIYESWVLTVVYKWVPNR